MKTELKQVLESARTAIDDARTRRGALVEQLANLDADRQVLRKAPLSRADVETILLTDITAQQDRALASDELMRELDYIRKRHVADRLDGSEVVGMSPLDRNLDSEVVDRLLAFSATPAEILSRLQSALDRLNYAGAGPAIAERREKLAAIAKKRDAIQAEISEIEALLVGTNPHALNAPGQPANGERKQINSAWATWIADGRGGGAWQFDNAAMPATCLHINI